nr:hypothetical protein [Mimivirus sp.]
MLPINKFNFAILAMLLMIIIPQISSLSPKLECPPPTYYPRDIINNLWAGPHSYEGTLIVSGSVQVDTTGEFDFYKIANLTGTIVQYYSEDIGTFVADYYLHIEGIPIFILNFTLTLTEYDKTTRYNQYCMRFDPEYTVSQYVEGNSINSGFFYSVYYHRTQSNELENDFNYGDVSGTEYFMFDQSRINSVNSLSYFNPNATLSTITWYNYHKISNESIHPISDLDVRKRQKFNSPLVNIGQLVIPLDMIDDKYKYLFHDKIMK